MHGLTTRGTNEINVKFRGPTSKDRKVEEGNGKADEGRDRRERKEREKEGGMGKEGRKRKRVRPAHFSDASAAYVRY